MIDVHNKTGSSNGNGKIPSLQMETLEHGVIWRDYARVFFKGRYAILISFALIVIFTIILTLTTESVYEANVRLMLEEQTGMSESLFDFTSMMKKETLMNNQVEILNSRTLAEQVVRDLKSSSSAKKLRLINDEEILAEKKSKINLLNNNQGKIQQSIIFDEQVQLLRDNLRIRPIRNTDMIEIKYRASSPFESEYIANAVAHAYERANQEENQAEVRQVKDFLEEQLELYEEELSESEEDLKKYQESAKVVALDHETSELVRKIAEIETLYNGAKTELEANNQRLAYIDSEINRQQKNFDVEAISTNTSLQEIKRRLAEKQTQLALYESETIEKGETDYTKKEIESLHRQINALKEQFKEEVSKIAASDFIDPAEISGSLFSSKIEVETERRALEPKVEAFAQILEDYNIQLESLPEKKLQLARLSRSAQVAEKIYIMLQEKYQESRISEVGQLGNVRIIDPAKAPKDPILPKVKLNIILGIFIGLGLGIAIAFIMEYMDNSVNTMEDVEAIGFPLIATIPFIKPEKGNGVLSRISPVDDPEANEINERLVTHLKPKSPVSEAYRTLRTNIIFTAPENPKNVILVTSSGPKEGKSTSVSNLAITFSQMGTKTLLIDADLRRPMLHKLFQLEKESGLTNVLVGKQELMSTVQKVKDLPNLHVLTCGVIPPNPAELLGSESMKLLLEQARQEFPIILIDTPPVIAVTDPSVLSRFVDGVVVIVKSGSTKVGAAVVAADQLRRIEAPTLGVTLNGVSTTNFYDSYFYYYKYNSYYGTDGNSRSKQKKKSKRPLNLKLKEKV